MNFKLAKEAAEWPKKRAEDEREERLRESGGAHC